MDNNILKTVGDANINNKQDGFREGRCCNYICVIQQMNGKPSGIDFEKAFYCVQKK